MPNGFLPNRQALLEDFTFNMRALLTNEAADYGLDVTQTAEVNTAATAFLDAYRIATDPTTRSPVSIAAKKTAKLAWIQLVRRLVPVMEAYPGMTDAKRRALGIPVRDADPTPVPAPTSMPQIEFISTLGSAVKIRLSDSENTKRKKPVGAAAALIYTWVGDNRPAALSDWKFQGATTRSINDISFPATVAPGSTVWFTALWVNRKMQPGPACQPVSLNIAGGGVSMAA